MPRPLAILDPSSTRDKLDELTAVVRREAEGAEADPFDGAMAAALACAVDALKAEAGALVELEKRLGGEWCGGR